MIFVNNGVYGMTGGQMAPTTLLDQVTTTTPTGRDAALAGHPVRICEVFAQLDGTAYLERVAVNKPAAVVKTKKAIRKAFQRQLDGAGFSLVEILSPCPMNWKMGTVEACTWIDEVMSEEFPLGVFKEVAMLIKTFFSGSGGQGVLSHRHRPSPPPPCSRASTSPTSRPTAWRCGAARPTAPSPSPTRRSPRR